MACIGQIGFRQIKSDEFHFQAAYPWIGHHDASFPICPLKEEAYTSVPEIGRPQAEGPVKAACHMEPPSIFDVVFPPLMVHMNAKIPG